MVPAMKVLIEFELDDPTMGVDGMKEAIAMDIENYGNNVRVVSVTAEKQEQTKMAGVK